MRRSEPGSPHPITTEAPAAEATGARPGAPGERRATAVSPSMSQTGAVLPAPEPSFAVEEPHGPRPVPVTVWRRVPGDRETAFDVVVPVDLSRVFTGYGPLPAVTDTEGERGTWGVEGQSRTVRLAGGGQLDETVVRVSYPGHMAYRVVPTRGPLRLAVRSIDGRFIFAPSEAGGTVIRWTYVFRPRRGAGPIVRLIAPLWRRYATQVLDRLAALVIAQSAAPAEPAQPTG